MDGCAWAASSTCAYSIRDADTDQGWADLIVFNHGNPDSIAIPWEEAATPGQSVWFMRGPADSPASAHYYALSPPAFRSTFPMARSGWMTPTPFMRSARICLESSPAYPTPPGGRPSTVRSISRSGSALTSSTMPSNPDVASAKATRVSGA